MHERAGFASAAEAMGGMRYVNGFPDEPPPRMHLSLGDTLSGMFAAHGILAALYWRDALGGGKGQVIDVSLLESCFAMLESMAPEYDRLGIVRGPGGTHLKGIAPSNIFKSQDGKWVVIAANAGQRLRASLRSAWGGPSSRTTRSSPPTSPAARTRRRSRASSGTGRRPGRRRRSTRSSTPPA